jgi:hypothetical protein
MWLINWPRIWSSGGLCEQYNNELFVTTFAFVNFSGTAPYGVYWLGREVDIVFMENCFDCYRSQIASYSGHSVPYLFADWWHTCMWTQRLPYCHRLNLRSACWNRSYCTSLEIRNVSYVNILSNNIRTAQQTNRRHDSPSPWYCWD